MPRAEFDALVARLAAVEHALNITPPGGGGGGDTGGGTGGDGGGGTGGDPNAGYDLTCVAQPGDPVFAPSMITISGVVSGVTLAGISQVTSPLGGALVAIYVPGQNGPVAQGMTDPLGNYTLTIPTNGLAVNASIVTQAVGFITQTTARSRAYANDATVEIALQSADVFALQSSLFAGGNINFDQDGVVVVTPTDCAGTVLAGAMIELRQNNVDVGTSVELGSFDPQSAGTVYFYNVPAGDTIVGASRNGVTLKPFTLPVVRGRITTLSLNP